jgi:UDP-N-acetyl-D-mannosaminuronate dehydrogenase
MTKLLENIYRAVNIGLVNELKIAADKMGIDIWEVIRAASTKPFGFTPFYPGPGLGGHCIPIDPFYLTWKARGFGVHTRFIELAGEINRSMPEYVVRRVTDVLNEESKSLKGSRILLLGLAYKPNVDDDRESPRYRLSPAPANMQNMPDENPSISKTTTIASSLPPTTPPTRNMIFPLLRALSWIHAIAPPNARKNTIKLKILPPQKSPSSVCYRS